MQSTLRLPLHAVRSCRLVAGRRYALASSTPYRSFHQSISWRTKPSSDTNGSSGVNGNNNTSNEATPVDVPSQGLDPAVTKRSSPRRRSYIETIRSGMRDRRVPDERPPANPIALPRWYLDRNIALYHEPYRVEKPDSRLGIISKPSTKDDSQAQSQATGGDDTDGSGQDRSWNRGHRYVLSPAVWENLRGQAKAGFMLPPQEYINDPATENSHILLQAPFKDGVTFLDTVVHKLARDLDANLVTLNAQDIAQLCSEQERLQGTVPSTIRSLSYEIYNDHANEDWPSEGAEKDDEAPEETSRTFIAPISSIRSRILSADGGLPDISIPPWLKSLTGSPAGDTAKRPVLDTISTRSLLNKIVSSALRPQPADSEKAPELPSKVIVQIQDYDDLKSSRQGSKVLEMLQEIIRHARRRGDQILLIGTLSRDEVVTLEGAPPALDDSKMVSVEEVKDFPTSTDPFPQTFLIVPATDPETTKGVFDEDYKARTRLINIRHLQDMIRTRVNPNTTPIDSSILDSTSWELDSEAAIKSLESNYWNFGRVHGLVTYAIGRVQSNETFGLQHIQEAFQLVDENEKAGQKVMDALEGISEPAESSGPHGKSKSPSALAPKCNKHEKKLLNGVVKADSIRTTFSDVHVPPETVEAINSLTSLSLIRPEAFSYGVLATDRIPGILLYGPPGTGKTLLAKAVARESGATVLEVSGSDIYDMYVGEGEKNVRAIFSLAKKLSPCVVFIDEADAMLGSRSQGRHRSSHRELINQFLREWDGMNDMSAFLMVATNRPFDLDDAVLRRLPRRLLVDLPTEKDREAILRIHLKEEQLEASVNLSELAHQTPFYSGSDLKNVCVAAALACVREEHAQSMQQQKSGEGPHEFPRRVLTKAHFERGIEEISASISEDMSSLNAIRKFDEKYGDRKGRRKRSAGWGFTAAAEAESGETGRVRP
ncbi:uncharacterized protein TRUGW13939_07093 [Talaromyces rugulosus]|uniref:AAA+ ATPase domain-containing protein n=1 Tax=Talaromyces rugulosus TaxID=121627 RepID=A0A7H8R2U1_TALRU|nr:uncharacterized protein TRUGW13939_07093 [Talaromyces rugulosus]QKX59951.1 hypothetical protein TRUGW13939_07093 [Talaromyces rugulosus]